MDNWIIGSCTKCESDIEYPRERLISALCVKCGGSTLHVIIPNNNKDLEVGEFHGFKIVLKSVPNNDHDYVRSQFRYFIDRHPDLIYAEALTKAFDERNGIKGQTSLFDE
jgi:hypothetical protein